MKRILLIALLLSSPVFSGCASNPPATYTPAVTRAYNADQFIKDLNALSQTARNLNATTGKLHLSDHDTALVRDFTIAAGAGLVAYGQGATTLATARAILDTLNIPPGNLQAVRAAFDQAVVDHQANASVLMLIRDVYLVFRAKMSINIGLDTTMANVLTLIDAEVQALPIP